MISSLDEVEPRITRVYNSVTSKYGIITERMWGKNFLDPEPYDSVGIEWRGGGHSIHPLSDTWHITIINVPPTESNKMSKFNVGDVVRVVFSSGNLSYGKLYTVMYYGKSSSGYEDDMVGVTAAEPQWEGRRFTLVEPYKKPSLRFLYETERDKLTAQQDITTAAWELVVAEKAMEDNARKALLHAKQVEVGCVRDRYLQVCNELDEMLRNEPL
jgi:hypothetical protein